MILVIAENLQRLPYPSIGQAGLSRGAISVVGPRCRNAEEIRW